MSTTPTSQQVSTALMWSGLLLLTYLLYLVLQPFLMPLGWACVLAVMVHPAHVRLAGRIGPGRAAAASTAAIALLMIVPTVLLAGAFAREMVDIATRLQGFVATDQFGVLQRGWDEWTHRLPLAASTDLGAFVADGVRRAATMLMAESGSIVANIAIFFIDLALSLIATFFLLREADTVMTVIRRVLPMGAAEKETFIQRTGELIAAGVTSSVIVAGLQGLLGGVAFALLGIDAAVFWGVVMAFACLLPFGAWVIWLPAAVILMASGAMTKGIVLLVLGAGLVSMVDNVVRPLLLSGRVRMNGLVIFVSLLGGLNTFGLLGIVLGPIVVVTAMALVTSYADASATAEGASTH